jgi:hypothetical protein
MWQKVTGERKLQDEELHNLYYSSNIGVIKSWIIIGLNGSSWVFEEMAVF